MDVMIVVKMPKSMERHYIAVDKLSIPRRSYKLLFIFNDPNTNIRKTCIGTDFIRICIRFRDRKVKPIQKWA